MKAAFFQLSPLPAPARSSLKLASGLWLLAFAAPFLPAQTQVPGSSAPAPSPAASGAAPAQSQSPAATGGKPASPASTTAPDSAPAPAAAPVGTSRQTGKPAPLPEALQSALRDGLFEEEANRDFDKAISAYRAALDLYDRQRPGAGTVLYRLAECFRKTGRTPEALPLYRRVLAEFPADNELCADARRRLAELDPDGEATAADGTGNGSAAMSQEDRNTLADLQVLAGRNPAMLAQRAGILNSAASHGSLPLIRFFVEQKVGGMDFSLPLSIAAGEGHLPVVKFLISSKPDSLDLAGALRASAAAGSLPVVEYLLANGADAKRDGGTALIDAMTAGKTAVTYKLIDAGADLNTGAPPPQGVAAREPDPTASDDSPPGGLLRPLALALDAGDELLARFLVEKGARCNAPSETKASNGQSPLHLASNAGFVRFLADHGALLEAKNSVGLTPVLSALLRNANFEVVEALIAAGADLNAKTPGDGTVIHCLTQSLALHPAFADPAKLPMPLFAGSQDMVKKDDPRLPELRAAAVRILDAALKAGVPVDALTKLRSQAAPSSRRRMVAGRIAGQSDIEITGTALAEAASWMDTAAQADFLAELIQRGAKVNFANDQGITPLHSAALARSLPVLQVLLKNGADPMAETRVPMRLNWNTPGNPVLGLISENEQPGRGSKEDFFRYRPMHLISAKGGAARDKDKDAILLLAGATYAQDFPGRGTGIWQDFSLLKSPYYESTPLWKLADPALDGKKPVTLLEAVMRAEPGLEANGSPAIHILRRRADGQSPAEDIVFDLNQLIAAEPVPQPDLLSGDVLLILPRESGSSPNSNGNIVVPLPRNLALQLEEKQAINISLSAPEDADYLNGDWRIYRPLISADDARVDTVRHTAWSGLSLPHTANGLFKFQQSSKLRLRRIVRATGEELVDSTGSLYSFGNYTSPVFLRDGDKIEIAGPEAAGDSQSQTPVPGAIVPPVPGTSVPGLQRRKLVVQPGN